MDDLFLDARNVSKRYGGITALDRVDFSVRRSEIHCLVGENGSGKSTLVKIITGVVQPEPGAEIVIESRHLRSLTPHEALLRGIQVVHQDLSLFPNLSVEENIAMLRHLEANRGLVRWDAIRETGRAALEKIGVALGLETAVGTLPVADQQLVAICRALASDARLLIMDEPTSSLTRREVDRLLGILRDLQARGIAVLFVSHKLDEILEIAQRVTILRDGRKIGTFPREEITRARLVHLMTGKEIAYAQRQQRDGAREVVLEVRGLSKKGNFADVSFALRRGEVLGIVGPLGSGRTELALSLFGMNPPDAGSVRVDGQMVGLRANAEAIRSGIAYVPEDRLTQGIVAAQSVERNLVITALDRLVGPLRLIDPRRKDKHCADAVERFDIKTASLDVPARTLSGGNQQKAVIAKWLSIRPRILILDGPTIGIDVAARENIYEIIRALARDGVSVVLISDEVPEVLYNCDRILVMRNGRLAGEVDPRQTSEEDLARRLVG